MKGQQKIKRGSGFRGVLAYVLDHDDPEYISGTLPIGPLKQMTSEFIALARTRSDIQKPVWHNSLRLPEGESITNEKWALIAKDYMQSLGFDDKAQWIAFKHNKSDGEHIHIIANRILTDGTIYLGRNENLISTRIISNLEHKYQLTTTKTAERDCKGKIIRREKTIMKKNEQEKVKRTSHTSDRYRLQQLIDEAILDAPTILDFVHKLRTNGVSVIPNIASTGRMNGLSFSLDNSDLIFSGSKLGTKYKWSNLLKLGLQYHFERDTEFLMSLKKDTVEPSDENTLSPIRSTQASKPISDEQKEYFLKFILANYRKFDNRYYCLSSGKLAFTEEDNKIICHLNTIEAITAQTKLAKIKFGDEFQSYGSYEFRRESWFQAALHGCLDHGFQPSETDIAELKERLSKLQDQPDLHKSIVRLITDSEGDGKMETHSEKQLVSNNTEISAIEQKLNSLSSERKQLEKQYYRLTYEDKRQIYRDVCKRILPHSKLKKLSELRKKAQTLKEELNQKNNWLYILARKKALRHTLQDIQILTEDINDPTYTRKLRAEYQHILASANQHNLNMRLRKYSNLKSIDTRIEALRNELKRLASDKSRLLNSHDELNRTNKAKPH
jgi:hypothetical protein